MKAVGKAARFQRLCNDATQNYATCALCPRVGGSPLATLRFWLQ